MKKISVLILMAAIFPFCFIASEPQVVGGDKTFTGKVIDADTKEPIEGAVVVAVWNTEWAEPTATHTDLKDVKECLTDVNGEWSVKGPKGLADEPLLGSSLIIPYTKEPEFIIFKPGYCSWPKGFYIDSCEVKLKPKGNGKIREGATIELPSLTKKEDRLKALPDPIGEGKKEFYKKQKIFLRVINKESRYLDIPEYKILEELENEK